MTPETQSRVFDPFFTTKPTGHGLGLAVVQGIVRNLRGTIRLVSAPGKGSMFQILLPCAEESAQVTPSAISQREEEKTSSRETTILFVEDEELIRQAASKMLRKQGFAVIEASDGSAALDLIRAHKEDLDVLLLDVTLPGTSSRELFAEAKRLRPDLAVIVTSANSEEVAGASLANSVERFLRKPFRLADLIDMIRQAVSS